MIEKWFWAFPGSQSIKGKGMGRLFSSFVGGTVGVLQLLMFSGCAGASPAEGDQNEGQVSPRDMGAWPTEQTPSGGCSSTPLKSSGKAPQPKAPSHLPPDQQAQAASAVPSGSGGKAEARLPGAEPEPKVPKAATPPSGPLAKGVSGSASPGLRPVKSSPSEVKPKPIYGLPLEYHFELPEVPERIRGPTPMPVVSKPALPGPRPKRE